MRRLLFVALVAAGAPAQGATITFDEIDNTGSASVFVGTSYLTPQGFRFTSTDTSSLSQFAWPRSFSENADPNGATLNTNHSGTTTTVQEEGGNIFTLDSVDLADVFNCAILCQGGDVDFTFTFSDNSTASQAVTIDNLPGLQTFTFNETNLKSFSYTPLTTYGRFIQVDNLAVDVAGASPVPEPASLLLLASGLVGLISRQRRAS